MKKLIVRLLAVALVVTLVVSLAACGTGGGGTTAAGDGGTITLRVGSGHAETNPWIISFEQYFVQTVEARVAAETDYTIEWVRAYGGSVITLGNELEGIEAGMLDIGCIILVFEASRLPLQTMMFSMPFTVPTPELGAAAYAQLIQEFPQMTQSFENFNQVYLGLGFSDPYGLYSAIPVTSLADVAGARIGAAGINLAWVEGSGAAGVQTSIPEAYQNIQTAVIDMTTQPTRSMMNLMIYEVTPYYLNAGFGAKPFNAITMNQQSWDSMPAAVQQILAEEGAAYLARSTAFMADIHAGSLEHMAEVGVTVHTLSREDQEAWAASLDNIVAGLVNNLDSHGYPGAEIVERWFALLEEQGHPRIRDWLNE